MGYLAARRATHVSLISRTAHQRETPTVDPSESSVQSDTPLVMTTAKHTSSERRTGRGWTFAALLIFLIGIASLQYSTWNAGFNDYVGFPHAPNGEKRNALLATDQLWVVGFVGRNARTLLNAPLDYYEAEHCFPATTTLAYSDPMAVLSLAGVPAYALTQSPAATYNFGVLALLLMSAMAMYWIVRDWTGIPAAGIVAGLLYGFEQNRITDLIHIYIYDATWTVLALFFARRWFAEGRWRDAAGLAAAIALQFGAAFYPVIAALCISMPFLLWLSIHYGFSRIRWTQVVMIVGIAGLAGAVIYGPYIALAGSSSMPARSIQVFALIQQYFPGHFLFPGWFCLILAGIGLALGGFTGLPFGARISLVAGGLLIVWLASGPAITGLGLPNLYDSLSFIPGLNSVRAPSRMAPGINLGLCILAGSGAAALLRPLRGAAFAAASGALILVTGAVALGAPTLGLPRPANYEPRWLALESEDTEFFATLEKLGNRGPILELPIEEPGVRGMVLTQRRLYRTMSHERRTSTCAGSYQPKESTELALIKMDAFGTELVERLYGIGFTTIIVHHPSQPPKQTHPLVQLHEIAQTRGSGVRLLHRNKNMTAFELDVSEIP